MEEWVFNLMAYLYPTYIEELDKLNYARIPSCSIVILNRRVVENVCEELMIDSIHGIDSFKRLVLQHFVDEIFRISHPFPLSAMEVEF